MQETQKFTLIEMLVVISIIGILASLLMPTLNSAVETSRSTACLNNEKQIGYTFAFYTNDFNNYVVPLEYNTNAAGYPAILTDLGYYQVSNKIFFAPVGEYTTIFTCASGDNRIVTGAITDRYDRNAAGARRTKSDINGWVVDVYYALNSCTFDKTYYSTHIPFTSGEIYIRKLSSIKRPSKFVALLDGYFSNFASIPARLDARHQNQTTTNVLFADGSAKTTDIILIPYNFSVGNLNANYPEMIWRSNQ